MVSKPLNQTKPFFPREMEFWIYNSCGWGIIVLYLLVSVKIALGSSFWNLVFSSEFVGIMLMWIIGTIPGLIFRRWYHQKQWHKHSILKIFPYALLIGILSGLVAMIIIAVDIYFFGETPEEFVLANGEILTIDYFVNLRGNGIAASVLVTLWCVAYLSIKGSRNTKELRFKALELESNLKEARLNVLSGQINPHFLFNALNNIRFMIHEDARRADDSLISLSEILRHSLESSKNEKVELAQEFAIVKQYLKLMKNQMEDRLSYSIEINSNMDKILIPPMIVQMLVENAIKHGIEHQKQGGTVNVECSQTSDLLTIEVSNTALVDDVIPNHLESSAGIGLQNINKRLSLIYGSAAKLNIVQNKGLVIARLELPKETPS